MRARVAAILAVLNATPLSADIGWQTARMAPGSLLQKLAQRKLTL